MTIWHIFQIYESLTTRIRVVLIFLNGRAQVFIQPRELFRDVFNVGIILKMLMSLEKLLKVEIFQAIFLIWIYFWIFIYGKLGHRVYDVIKTHFAHFLFFGASLPPRFCQDFCLNLEQRDRIIHDQLDLIRNQNCNRRQHNARPRRRRIRSKVNVGFIINVIEVFWR